jgi:hypothetical protein
MAAAFVVFVAAVLLVARRQHRRAVQGAHDRIARGWPSPDA